MTDIMECKRQEEARERQGRGKGDGRERQGGGMGEARERQGRDMGQARERHERGKGEGREEQGEVWESKQVDVDRTADGLSRA